MVDESQIKKWLKEGTITKDQADKMISDSSSKDKEEKSNKFIAIISIIGAVLIFIGLAWLIANNWRQIPDFVKVLILVSSTLGAFISGVVLKDKDHEYVGRALITLGALLFLLSLFLISQIYHLATTTQHYAFLLLFAWVVILITAYLLDSPENVVVSMVIFFWWAMLQYISTADYYRNESALLFGFVLILISAGALLFGVSSFHSSIEHKFAGIYKFWTAFYFFCLFYALSFQSILPFLSMYSLSTGSFQSFLIIFVLLCSFAFLIGSVYAASKRPNFLKEIFIFIGILALIIVLILSTRVGTGQTGYCQSRYCYDYKTQIECSPMENSPLNCEWIRGSCMTSSCRNYGDEQSCNNPKSPLVCRWQGYEDARGYCTQKYCNHLDSETECVSSSLNCEWTGGSDDFEEEQFDTVIYGNSPPVRAQGFCMSKEREFEVFEIESSIYTQCRQYNNQKKDCSGQEFCKWQPSSYVSYGRNIPTSFWLLWILNNIVFVGFILLMIWYGQRIGSTKIVNLSLFFFIVNVITRYIGFWMDLRGYFAFSILAIIGGLLLIGLGFIIPKWRRKILEGTIK